MPESLPLSTSLAACVGLVPELSLEQFGSTFWWASESQGVTLMVPASMPSHIACSSSANSGVIRSSGIASYFTSSSSSSSASRGEIPREVAKRISRASVSGFSIVSVMVLLSYPEQNTLAREHSVWAEFSILHPTLAPLSYPSVYRSPLTTKGLR